MEQEYPPVSLFAELAPTHVIDGAQAELVGARWDEATNSNPGGLWLNVGQQHCPRGIWDGEDEHKDRAVGNNKWIVNDLVRALAFLRKTSSALANKFKFDIIPDYYRTPLFHFQY